MKVTIIPSDTYCAVDGVGYEGVDMSTVSPTVHAVQFNAGSGWIEFVTLENGTQPQNQPIDNLDQFEAVLASWAEIDYQHKNPPPPPPPTAEQNKEYASMLLQQTDWTQIPSVSDPAESNPYLTNASEFAEYRKTVREIAINPVAGDLNWPTKPAAVWVSA